MKTLLLMRHAKSSWKDSKLDDKERPLNKRGRSDAPIMGQILIDRELIPQCILSSSALRARQTAEAVIESSGYPGEVTYLDQLYMAEVEGYIAVLRELPDDVERVMLIGHNPGLETLLQILSGSIESLPTAVLAHLVLPINQWSQLTAETQGQLVDIWRPKELREETQEKEAEKEKEKAKKGKEKAKGKAKPKKKAK
jgi:phosphohistidine phosphatase